MNPGLQDRVTHVWAIAGVMRLGGLMGLALLLGLIASACSQGTYPLDIFQEMHYQQSYSAGEPDRLDVPAAAVPYSVPRTMDTGKHLFDVNCALCHGATGQGNGPVLNTLIEKYAYMPVVDPDLTGDIVRNLPDAALLALISKGIHIMPAFEKLLTLEEMRLIVGYLRQLP